MSPATNWKETIPPDESARFERHAEALREMQRRHAAGAGKKLRALHAKPNAGLEAELTVLPDLPQHARVGLFATPGTFRAYVRFSNGSGVPQPDQVPDVRGAAIKVVGVPGKKIIPGLEDAKTVDFLLIKQAVIPFRDADEFVGLLLAADRPLPGLFRFVGQVGLCRAVNLMWKLSRSLAEPVTSVATTRYYSAVPIKFGPYAVHYALEPEAAPEPLAVPGVVPGYIGEEITERLRRGSVSFDFRVQFYVDAERTSIEDASVEWQEKDAPFLTVARLVLLKQDTQSPRGHRVAELVESLSFDPWHTIEDFRPLGNMMRARNPAYRLSTQERGAAPEPDGTEQLDG
jgi:hypothetical protein